MDKKIIKYIFGKFDRLITSIVSPEVFCILLPIILGTCYHKNIIDTITDTQAKILLQKEHLNPLQYQMTETWMATDTLLFLFKEYSKPGKNERKFKDEIQNSYEYWKQLTRDWKQSWKRKFNDIAEEVKEKKDKEKLQKQFDAIVKYFEENFFNKINVCYNNYYSKDESCITPTLVLPLPSNITEFQKNIYLFYINTSKAKT